MWDLIVSVPDHCLSFYFARLQDWPLRWPLQDDSRLLIGYRVSQTIDVIRPRVAVTRPTGPAHGSIPHDSSTNLSCQIERRLSHTQLLTLTHAVLMIFYSWKRINPNSLRKLKNMTELILYIFGMGKSSPKVWRHQNTAAMSSKFYL